MTKFKYNDKVLAINDESDGFFVGLEGEVKSFSKNDKGAIRYEVWVEKSDQPVYFREEDLQKI